MLVEEGEYKLYHSVWEPPIICVAWKISSSHSCCVDSKSMPFKMLFNLYFKIELWHLYKSLLPSVKGLPIYVYVEKSSFLLKAPAGEHTVVCIHYYWFILGMTWLDLFYHELQCLVSPWSLKVLWIYVLRSQKGLARYHFVISCCDCFKKVLSSEIYYYCSLFDYAIDMSKHET